MLTLAEIGDKVPSLAVVAMVSVVIATVTFTIGRVRKWLVLVPLPLMMICNCIAVNELLDRSLSAAIKAELGTKYIVLGFAFWNSPYILASVCALLLRRRRYRGFPMVASGPSR